MDRKEFESTSDCIVDLTIDSDDDMIVLAVSTPCTAALKG